jgi:hypothetical protein
MPKKAKVRRGKRKNPSGRSAQKGDVERFLEYARSIGIDPTYDEYQRALKRIILPKRRHRRAQRAS